MNSSCSWCFAGLVCKLERVFTHAVSSVQNDGAVKAFGSESSYHIIFLLNQKKNWDKREMLLIIFPLIKAVLWGCLRQLFKEHLDKRTSLVAHVVKNLPAMQETQIPSLGWEDPLEKEMAAHSSILGWRIPWTEEPGGLQSTGSQRVGHDWATSPSPSPSYSETWKFRKADSWVAFIFCRFKFLLFNLLLA